MRTESEVQRLAEVGRLYDRLGRALYRYSVMLLADVTRAEDVVQDVFASMVQRGVPQMDSAEAYLARAVRNRCYDVLRQRRRGPPDDSALLEGLPGTTADPNRRLAIERALRTLPEVQREVV